MFSLVKIAKSYHSDTIEIDLGKLTLERTKGGLSL